MIMKKILFAIPASVLMLAACSSVEDEPKMQDDLKPIAPILFSDLMVEANNQTRGTSLANNDTIGVVVWDLNKTTSNIVDTDLSGNAPKSSWAVLPNIASSNSNLALTPKQYYNANTSYNSFMFAYYPADGHFGTTLSTSGNRNIITFGAKDGTIDVCASAMGSANKTETQPTLTLAHKTAWITFKVKSDGSVTAGTNVTRIWLTGATVPASMTLSKSGASVSSSTPVNLKDAYSDANGKTLTTTAQDAKSYDLFISPASAGIVKVNATTAVGSGSSKVTTTYNNVDLKNNSNANLPITAGNHYVITLTFSQKDIKPTVSVTNWTDINGTASLQ